MYSYTHVLNISSPAQYKRDLEAAHSGVGLFTPQQLRDKFARQGAAAAAAAANDKQDASAEEKGAEETIGSSNNPTAAIDSTDRDNQDDEKDDDEEAAGRQTSAAASEPSTDPARRGTEVALRRLELRDSIASVALRRLRVELRCLRCRRKLTAELTAGAAATSLACQQCGAGLRVGFRASLLHPMSGSPAVAGYLDLTGCLAEDALLTAGDCEFVTVCLGCQLPHTHHGPLAAGTSQPLRYCCLRCHAWGGLLADGVRLTVLSAPAVAADGKVWRVGRGSLCCLCGVIIFTD